MYSEYVQHARRGRVRHAEMVSSAQQGDLPSSGVVWLRGCVMTAKPLLVMLLATLLGPAIGVGLFILIQTL